ncbi:enoyl-ACP reductase FabI [Raineya orbicola]|jgi:enoyl-[acyl-carrier protein] reductase I|uniref:Enoyl-[acyl-carrier-protein] reductase [NADH] n=1 Tax=Raineya orbicola TaxID=2016530 RepID=A0A2N3I9R8_9BACT|nr:enoyl-ACP reductase FabI [Raineya orbicola]PKQ67025.1 Enoyl-(acyl-carrier-protein) [Raineya orbicola]
MFNLTNQKGLIVGIANEKSIAYGCAKILAEQGAELAITYLNEKAEKFVRPLAEGLNANIIAQMDVQKEEEVKAVFEQITQKWGKLDFLIHSIAFAPLEDLKGRLIDCSADGFKLAMDISCHSFIRLAHYAENLLLQGRGSLIAMSYYGSEKVIKNYAIMGPVKAALESTVRYLAFELGEKGINVNAISPGTIATRAAGGLSDFDELMKKTEQITPLKRLPTIEDVGKMAAFLISDEAQYITGDTFYVDGGYHIMGV